MLWTITEPCLNREFPREELKNFHAKQFRLHSRTSCTRSRQEEEWEVIHQPVNNSREQNVLALIVHGHPFFFLEIEMCKRNVQSGFRLHSRFSRSEASFLFCCFSSDPPAPPMTVDLCLVVTAVTPFLSVSKKKLCLFGLYSTRMSITKHVRIQDFCWSCGKTTRSQSSRET